MELLLTFAMRPAQNRACRGVCSGHLWTAESRTFTSAPSQVGEYMYKLDDTSCLSCRPHCRLTSFTLTFRDPS